jgi:hypothetical protein
MGRVGQERQGLPPARESTGQDLEQQGLEDEDKLMLQRGILRPHADDEEGQDGPPGRSTCTTGANAANMTTNGKNYC